MIIHNSHTKDSLIKIIKVLELDIKHSNLIKEEIKDNLIIFCQSYEEHIRLKRNPYNFKTIKDLLGYLESPNDKKKIMRSLKEKEKLIEYYRKIISFVNNGSDFDLSVFDNEEDLHFTIIFICKFGGSISTCRRAIKTINDTLPPNKKYEMYLDTETQEELNKKELKKYLNTPKFHSKEKKVLITFD